MSKIYLKQHLHKAIKAEAEKYNKTEIETLDIAISSWLKARALAEKINRKKGKK